MALHLAYGHHLRERAKVFPDLVLANLRQGSKLSQIRGMPQFSRKLFRRGNDLFSAHGFSKLIVENK